MDKKEALIKAVDITISAIAASGKDTALVRPEFVNKILRHTYKTLCELGSDAEAEYVRTFN